MKKYFLSFLLLAGFTATAQTNFYDPYVIEDIRIYFPTAGWDAILDAAVANETYTVADSVVINGQAFLQVGVKYKGNSSYSPTRAKNPFHIKLDYLLDQNYQGYEDLKYRLDLVMSAIDSHKPDRGFHFHRPIHPKLKLRFLSNKKYSYRLLKTKVIREKYCGYAAFSLSLKEILPLN